MQESMTYKILVKIISIPCDLTYDECHILMGRLSYIAEIAPRTAETQKAKPHRNSTHNPNITMLNCSSK